MSTQLLDYKDHPVMLTPKRLGSYPPSTWTAASTAIFGLMLGIIVSFRVIGETSSPAKIKVLVS